MMIKAMNKKVKAKTRMILTKKIKRGIETKRKK
jgi:hypothetical protein